MGLGNVGCVCVGLCMLGLTAGDPPDSRGTGPAGFRWTVAMIFDCDITSKLVFFPRQLERSRSLFGLPSVLVLLTSPERANCHSAIVWEDISPFSWIP